MKKVLLFLLVLVLLAGGLAHADGWQYGRWDQMRSHLDKPGTRYKSLWNSVGGPLSTELLVYLLSGQSLDDLSGELSAGVNSRVSATTRIMPGTGLLEQIRGERNQLIDTTAQNPAATLGSELVEDQNPVDGQTWWILVQGSFDEDGGFIADTASNYHLFNKPSLLSGSTVYKHSIKAKAGNVSWVYVALQDDTSQRGAYFNLSTGTVGTIEGILSTSISSVDEDGYYTCTIVDVTGTVATNGRPRVYPAEADNDYAFAGDGQTPAIYVKDISLKQLVQPSWWITVRGYFDEDGGFMPTSESNTHYFIKYSTLSANTDYLLSMKVKSGDSNYWAYTYLDDAGQSPGSIHFNLENNVFSNVYNCNSFGSSAEDSDGYSRIWLSFTTSDDVATNSIYISPTLLGVSGFAGDGSGPAIYIKEIMLEELPTGNVLGPDLVTDGGFDGDGSDWTQGTGWSIAGGVAVCDGTQTSGTILSQIISDDVLKSSRLFQLTYTVSNYSDGTITPRFGLGDYGKVTSANGTYTDYGSYRGDEASTQRYISLQGNSLLDATVDNVSVKEVPLSQYSTGFGIELVTGDNYTLDTVGDWTGEDCTISVSDNVMDIVYSNVTQKVNLSISGLTIGKQYMVSGEFRGLSNYSQEYVQVGVSPAAYGSGILLTSEWQTAQAMFTATATTHSFGTFTQLEDGESYQMKAGFTVREFTPLKYLQPSGYVNSDTIPGFSAYEENGLRYTPSVINLLPYSEDFSQWTLSGVTFGANVVGPDGLLSAITLQDPGGSSTYALYYTGLYGLVLNTQHTFSVFAKAGTSTNFTLFLRDQTAAVQHARTDFQVSDGVISVKSEDVGTGGVREIGNGWYRVWITCAADLVVSENEHALYLTASETGVDPTSTVTTKFFGANITPTNWLAPYIPSNGSQVALAHDNISWTLSDALKNILSDAEGDATSEGTLIAEVTPTNAFASTAYPDMQVLGVNGSNTSLMRINGSNRLQSYDGTTTFSVSVDDQDAFTPVVWSLTWVKDGNVVIGGKQDGAWTFSTAASYDGAYTLSTDLVIGSGAAYPFHIKNIRFYKTAFDTDFIEDNF